MTVSIEDHPQGEHPAVNNAAMNAPMGSAVDPSAERRAPEGRRPQRGPRPDPAQAP